jgi:hypothetical protein
MHALFYLANAAALITILFAWYKITALRKRIPGGLVKAVCDALGQFIGLFAFGYIALTFFPLPSQEYKGLLISLGFICVAVFAVTITNFFSTLASNSGF